MLNKIYLKTLKRNLSSPSDCKDKQESNCDKSEQTTDTHFAQEPFSHRKTQRWNWNCLNDLKLATQML